MIGILGYFMAACVLIGGSLGCRIRTGRGLNSSSQVPTSAAFRKQYKHVGYRNVCFRNDFPSVRTIVTDLINLPQRPAHLPVRQSTDRARHAGHEGCDNPIVRFGSAIVPGLKPFPDASLLKQEQ